MAGKEETVSDSRYVGHDRREGLGWGELRAWLGLKSRHCRMFASRVFLPSFLALAAGCSDGIMARSIRYLFDSISRPYAGVKYILRASYLEIYNEQVCLRFCCAGCHMISLLVRMASLLSAPFLR